MTIGNKIVEFRKRAKLSQEKFAEKLGISRQTLSNYENDITFPDLMQAKNIAETLNISIDELVGNDNTMYGKITRTEQMIKKQSKRTKIILITLYFIILIFLIAFMVYFFTKRDFTSEYQTNFKCYNKKVSNDIYEVSLESGYITNKFDNDVEIKKITAKFNIVACRYDGKSDGCYEEKIYAGDDLGTALETIKKVKKIAVKNGYICK